MKILTVRDVAIVVPASLAVGASLGAYPARSILEWLAWQRPGFYCSDLRH